MPEPTGTMTRRTLISRGAMALAATLLSAPRLRAAVSPVTATLSRYMADAKDRPLPAEVLDAVKHHVLDTFAAMVSGSELPPGIPCCATATDGARIALRTKSIFMCGSLA